MKNKLPEGWKEVELGEISIIDSGQGAPQGEEWFNDSNIFIRAGDLNNLSEGKYVGDYCEKVSDGAVKKYGLKKYSAGCIVFPKSGMSIMTDNIAILKYDCYVVNHLAIIKPKDNDDSIFIYYLLKKVRPSTLSKNSSYPSIRISDIQNFKVIWPTKESRRKIVSILEKAEKAKEMRKKADELTKDFLKAVFMEMFGDPIKNKKKFETKKGEDLFKFSSGKFNPTSNLKDSFDFPTYGGNGITGYSKNYLIDFPTIVIGRVGAYCGCVHKTPQKSWITDNAIYIKDFKHKTNLDFLFYLFEFLKINRFALTVGQPKITQKPLEESDYTFPPIELQNKFASIVKDVEEMKEQQKHSKEQIDNLFNVLTQKAFKGELVI